MVSSQLQRFAPRPKRHRLRFAVSAPDLVEAMSGPRMAVRASIFFRRVLQLTLGGWALGAATAFFSRGGISGLEIFKSANGWFSMVPMRACASGLPRVGICDRVAQPVSTRTDAT